MIKFYSWRQLHFNIKMMMPRNLWENSQAMGTDSTVHTVATIQGLIMVVVRQTMNMPTPIIAQKINTPRKI